MAASFTLTGAKELEASLRQLAADTTKGTAKAAMKRGLIDAAAPLVAAARAAVPVGDGDLRDSIRASVTIANATGKREFAQTLRAGGSKEDAVAALRDARRAAGGGGGTVHVYVGPTAGEGVLKYAHLVEYGSSRQAPQPYMRTAWDQTQDQVLSSIVSSVDKAIVDAAQRAAKRKSRAAAKGA